jgi:membrane-bound lytic murein transglycosylase A
MRLAAVRKSRGAWPLAALWLLAACAEAPQTSLTPSNPVKTPAQPGRPATAPSLTEPETPYVPGPNPVPVAMRLSTLPGWDQTDPFIAIEALRSTCAYKKGRQYADICQAMAAQDFESPEQIKDFLNTHLQVEAIAGTGTLTGYYVPDYEAVSAPTKEFSQPVRSRPTDLVYVPGSQMTPAQSATKVAARRSGHAYVPYYSRAQIEHQPTTADYYMRPEDYFFMQIQGSGFLDTPDGKRVYAAYAADNGLPFTGIAKTLVEKGLMASDQTSGDAIHAWLNAHRGDDAQAIMNTDKRYIFFAINPDQAAPDGAAGLPLPPGSAVAIDPAYHDYGDLLWIDGTVGGNALNDAFPAYQRLVSALDTGGAIKGNVRADLYIGHGDRAGSEAGKIKHVLTMWKIVPYVAPQPSGAPGQ